MKKLMTIVGAIFLASVVLTSCGGGVEADAEKLCKLQCDGYALEKMNKEEPTEENIEKALKLIQDAVDVGKELKEKYKDDEEGQKDLAAAVAACKCD